jgi:hypothetical protein
VAVKTTVTDAFGLVLPQDKVEYSVDNENATVSPEGVFHATEPGEQSAQQASRVRLM